MMQPEIKALVEKRIASGAFRSIKDVLIDALELQEEQGAWLASERDTIGAKIDRGLAQLEQGQGMSVDQVRARLADRKLAVLSEQSGL